VTGGPTFERITGGRRCLADACAVYLPIIPAHRLLGGMLTSSWTDSGIALHFRRDGYAVLEGFLRPAELGPLRADVDEALAAPLPPGCDRPHNTLAPLRWNGGIIERVLSSRQRQQGLADAVNADDLRWISLRSS
jgi:hypothetical protein